MRDGRIGVDVETRYRNDLLTMLPLRHSRQRHGPMARTPPDERHDRLLAIWTLNKFVVRATGQVLLAPSQRYTMRPLPVELMTAPDGSNALNWRLHSMAFGVRLQLDSGVEGC
jgi:phosphopantetheinyl transferase